MELNAKTARQARSEIARRWPGHDVNYRGFDEDGECVLLSMVRGKTSGPVATATRNRSKPAVRFEADKPKFDKEPSGAWKPNEAMQLEIARKMPQYLLDRPGMEAWKALAEQSKKGNSNVE